MTRPRLALDARRAQIVKASMALFAKKGFSGTTSRALARAAGVSEALIFRLFPTKRALYSAIIQHQIAAAPPILAETSEPDRAFFLRLARTFLTRVQSDSTFLRLMLFSGLEGHALSDMYYRTHVSQVLDRLRQRIAGGIRAGRYRRTDPYLVARAFTSMLVHYALSQQIFLKGRPSIPPDRVAETFTDLFFSGLETPRG
jgi:AcrR family transcriptional regulator